MTAAPVPVVKMNGAHNEFVLVDARVRELDDPVAFTLRVCDPAHGIGADGVLLLSDTAHGDVRMRIINADGSEAEMCGNGVRCVARYLDEHDGRANALVETLAGPIATTIIARTPEYRVSVVMNAPVVGAAHEVAGRIAIPVDVGNPHVVIFVDDLASVDITTLGPRIERDPRYPHGTNVHVAQILGRQAIRVVHWERGAGATQACGTGAVATAAAAIATCSLTSPVDVHVPGGVLTVAWKPGERAVMTGDAVREFATTA
jgi:diaminopimelate epimerase